MTLLPITPFITPTTPHLMLITPIQLMTSPSTTLIIKTMVFHPTPLTHTNTLYLSSDPSHHHNPLLLPWTSANYTPKMPMDSGADNVIMTETSLQTVNAI
jgi:hypothetical protein